MSQPEKNRRQNGRERPVDEDMAYEAYKALMSALGGPVSRELGLTPEAATALYVTKLAAADPQALAARFENDDVLTDYGVTDEDLGQVAYEAYSHFVGGKSVSGQQLVGWYKLLPQIAAAWVHSAHAVYAEMVQEIRRRIDDAELRQSPEFRRGLEDWRVGRIEEADVCSPATGYHSDPHRRCVLRSE